MQDRFDFQETTEHHIAYEKLPSINAKLSYGRELLELQKAFMMGSVSQIPEAVDTTMEETDNSTYEVQKVLSHRGEDENLEFLVLWKGYSEEEATWEPSLNFNEQRCIRDYWKSKAKF
ncbi:hypothetical protein BGZ68_001931 [Mortierella alpina]|nr:hypothetical protein BGZ68_001931 [Mortierella alpina]